VAAAACSDDADAPVSDHTHDQTVLMPRHTQK
jgi:hypothetical protein